MGRSWFPLVWMCGCAGAPPDALGPEELAAPAAAPAPAPVAVTPDAVLAQGVAVIPLQEGRLPAPPLQDDAGAAPASWAAWQVPGLPAARSPEAEVALDRSTPWDTVRRVAVTLLPEGGVLHLHDDSGAKPAIRVPAAPDPFGPRPGLAVRLDTAGLQAWRDGVRLTAAACDAALCGPPDAWAAAELAALVAEAGAIRFDGGASPASQALAALERVAGTGPVLLDIPEDRPCPETPPGMACVPGGPFRAGAGEDVRDLWIPTFLTDLDPSRRSTQQACAADRVCSRPGGAGNPEDPARVSWKQASRLCTWTGKRLPTEWEWEKAASLGLISDPAPTWTASWAASLDRCGAAGTGTAPRGPCDGAPRCPSASGHVRRGGPDTPVSQRHLRGADGSTAAVRCVADPAPLTSLPPRIVARPLPERPLLEAPAPELLETFRSGVEDELEVKPVCEGPEAGGRSTMDCRDPWSYVKGNEPRIHLFAPYVANAGGGYVGVAADGNYSLAAVARAEWVWLVDYDPNVVRLHRVNAILVAASPDADAFVARWAPDAASETLALLEAALASDPERPALLRIYRSFRRVLHAHYTSERNPPVERKGLGKTTVPPGPPDFGWLRNPDQYRWIHALFAQGRVRAVQCDLLADRAMRSVGATARAMGVPIRVYYTSNAPSAWGGIMTPAYRENVRALPMDADSVVLQTLGFPTGFQQDGYWHYNVQGGLDLQRKLGLVGYRDLYDTVFDRLPGPDPDLSLTRLPGG